MTINESWDEELAYSRKFMPEIIEWLHKIFADIGWGDPEIIDMELRCEDVYHNTDLLAIFPDKTALRISVRVRKWDKRFWRQNMREFTMRVSLALNRRWRRDEYGYVITDTELKKTMDGWGDLIVYCIADPTDKLLASIFVGRTDALRKYNRLVEKHSGEGTARITHRTPEGLTVIDDEAPIFREWDKNYEHIAGNTGCGFRAYLKEGPGAIPDITIADYKFRERWEQ
ncbi:MAG: hypothetical protein LUD47_05115 [Clostridia bacterium]|nr:hypothetical protein [Clostridia bacterium]